MQERFEDFVTTVSTLYKQIQKLKNLEMQEFGLKGPHVMCIFHLSRQPEGLTASDLCRLSGVDKAAVSRSLGELEALGYIAYPQQQDRKKYKALARLTAAGEAVARRIRTLIDGFVEAAGRDNSPEEREILYGALHRISQNLARILEEAEASGYAAANKNKEE